MAERKSTIAYALVLFLGILFVVVPFPLSAFAADSPETMKTIWVLPQTSSAKLARLLDMDSGEGAKAWEFDGAKIERDTILATYSKKQDHEIHVTVQLSNISAAPKEALLTKKFALSATFGDSLAIHALMPLLRKHVALNETEWTWMPARVESLVMPRLSQNEEPPTSTVSEQVRENEERRFWDYRSNQVGMYLIVLFVLGILVNLLVNGRRRLLGPKIDLLREGPGLLSILAVGLLLRITLGMMSNITPDEASNLSQGFWQYWYESNETIVYPPLFQMLIHLTASQTESVLQLRFLPILFGMLSLWIFYRLARRSTSASAAQIATLFLALFVGAIQVSTTQKAYTLWTCLLLLSHEAFLDVMDGKRSRYTAYALWSFLAIMTHYLTPFYLAGHLFYIMYKKKNELFRFLLALLLATLALIPFLFRVVPSLDQIHADEGIGISGGFAWILVSAEEILLRAGGILVLVIVFLRTGRSARHEFTYLVMAVMGILVPFIFHLTSVVRANFFSPIPFFALLIILGRLDRRLYAWRVRHLIVLSGTVMLLMIFSGACLAYTYVVKTNRTLMEAYTKLENPSSTILVYPHYMAHAMLYKLTHSRMHQSVTCKKEFCLMKFVLENKQIYAIDQDVDSSSLDRTLAQTGGFDFMVYDTAEVGMNITEESSEDMGTWLDKNCTVLTAVSDVGTAYRCHRRANRTYENQFTSVSGKKDKPAVEVTLRHKGSPSARRDNVVQ